MSPRCLALVLVACIPQPTDTGDTTTGDTTSDEPTGGSPGEPQIVVSCKTALASHAAACPDPCPISVDVEIHCDDDEFAAPGLRVAASPDAVWLVTSSNKDAMLHTAGTQGVTRIALPSGFARGTILLAAAPSGDLHVATKTDGGIYHLAQVDDWQPTPVSNRYRLGDLEVDLTGVPHIWFNESLYDSFQATPDGDGWVVATAAAPAMAVLPHFGFTRTGAVVGVGSRGENLRLFTKIAGTEQKLGAPSTFFNYRLAPPTVPHAPSSGPETAAAIFYNDGIRIAWQDDSGILIPGTTRLVSECDGVGFGNEPCHEPCHDTAVGVEPSAFAFARTQDGRGWLAYMTTHTDTTFTYAPMNVGDSAPYCHPTVDSDHSTGVLHLIEVAFDDNEPIERLTLPIVVPALYDLFTDGSSGIWAGPRAIDVRAHGSSLAIGLRTRDSANQTVTVRLLRYET